MTTVNRDHLEVATLAFMKASIFDPSFNNPDASVVAAWAESIARHALSKQDVIDAVAVHYENVADRGLKIADVIKHSREIRRQRAEREKGHDARALTAPVATEDTRQSIVREIAEKFGRRSDSSKVLALGDIENLTIDTLMENLSAPGERWDRNRAAKALHAAHCINAGEEPPTVTYVRPERRKARERKTKSDAVAHFATRGYHVATAFKEGVA